MMKVTLNHYAAITMKKSMVEKYNKYKWIRGGARFLKADSP